VTRHEDCDDRVLIERTIAGEADCFNVLMKRHAGPVRSRISPMLRNPEDQDDVIQDVMLKAWRKLASFRGECSFRTWMTRVAINEALMSYRKRRALPVSCEADPETLRSAAENPFQAVERRETARRVSGAVNRMPEQYRHVLILRHIKELDLRETADFQGLSLPAVKSRLFRARRLLSATLRPEQARLSNIGKGQE
jgi:RNA polymerase sigma-70 factor, ECF subfamily